ncbi:hypothetical protein BKN14_02455 [Candidatus Gracilibacteria bacterium HOT-871]|nr:hypothetical protein BKN14_02455 [Candidatus Gracilibacteria bacterium HOT-871]MBB1564825.1 hypothetical protein [Candidatus Gracilibacteria bacterium]MBF0913752.1 hypothetical protein [Candidatus Gracilibacteria bacterium]RKW21687.1 MAG: hypothetical protein D8B46_06990 [Candidatus Gracilibacteria bacterium]
MFGFHYEYIKSQEIFDNIVKIYNYGIIEYSVLIGGILLIISMIFFIVPAIKSYLRKSELKKEKAKKKQMINRIVLQKNLEDLVMREVNEKR